MKSVNFPIVLLSLALISLSNSTIWAQEVQEKPAETQQADQSQTDEKQENQEWIQLFNGKDLSGWTPKIRGHELGVNYGDTFRVVDGYLTVAYDKYVTDDFMSMDDKTKADFNKFGHLFFKDKFSHYILRVEYRFIGEQVTNGPGWAYRNNGLMLHGEDPATMGVDQKFPISVEVQLLGGERGRTTLNLCTPGTNVEMNEKLFQPHCTSSKSKKYPGDQWVTVEIEVRGNEFLRHKIDGQTVLEYQKPQIDPRDAKNKRTSFGGTPEHMEQYIKSNGGLMLKEGTISIQSESAPTQFRKIELLKIDPEEK